MVFCPECGTQLEIIDDNPWELDYAEEYEGEAVEDTDNDTEEKEQSPAVATASLEGGGQ